ncbi:VOC family protein [Amycolatopsis jejuensis]|uniref:VOC family protein n=1 Tax=Amycolatopsis jejuensis TaxID=330084 RepID=UPI000523FE18|nr:VOC family protein [Amycolatopsis jejuensis]
MIIRTEPWPSGTPCWGDLMVPDRDKAVAFYSALLGWTVETGGPETGFYGMAQVAGKPVAGIGQIPPEQEGMPPAWTTYLGVSDVDKTVTAITEAGGSVIAPPMDVMTEGRMAIAMDPTGLVFGLWQPGRHLGTGVTLTPGAPAWNECMTRDFATAKQFYGDVFGYTFTDLSGDGFTYATLDVDGRPVGGLGELSEGGPAELKAGWNTYFWTSDADGLAARIPELGGTVVSPPTDTPYGRMVLARDDQGAEFSLMAPNEQTGTQEGWG